MRQNLFFLFSGSSNTQIVTLQGQFGRLTSTEIPLASCFDIWRNFVGLPSKCGEFVQHTGLLYANKRFFLILLDLGKSEFVYVCTVYLYLCVYERDGEAD